MNPNQLIQLLEETNQLSEFHIEVATEKGTLNISFTPNVKGEKEDPQDLSFLKELEI